MRRSRILALIVSLLALTLAEAAFGGPALQAGATSPNPQAVGPDRYPPLPLAPQVTVRGCLGRHSVGMSTERTDQLTHAVAAEAKPGGSNIVSIGSCPGGPVLVGLGPGQELLAHQLWAHYGDQMALTVGLTTYNGHPGRSPKCGVLATPASLPEGLRLSLHLRMSRVRTGSMLSGTVLIHEDGPASFDMDTGQPLQAVVVRTGTRRVVGVYSGAIGGTGFARRVGARSIWDHPGNRRDRSL